MSLNKIEAMIVIVNNGDIHEGNSLYWGQRKTDRQDKVITFLQNIGDLFGEMGVISGAPRSSTVQAADAKTLVLGVDSPTVDRKLLAIIAYCRAAKIGGCKN